MKAALSLILTVVTLQTGVALAAEKSPQEKCATLAVMSQRTRESQESIKSFLTDFDKLNGEEQKTVLTANTQKIYLRLKFFEKLSGLKVDEKIMRDSGDLLNDVIVGGVYSEIQAIEKMKARLAPLNEQMLSILNQYEQTETFKKCKP